MNGRGKLILDRNNPYLAPNKFLTEESNASETLKGFLSVQGSPEEIEFSDSIFSKPKLTLFYPNRDQFYSLEYTEKDWIITGPFEKDSDDKDNKDGTSALVSDSSPLININSKETINLNQQTSQLPSNLTPSSTKMDEDTSQNKAPKDKSAVKKNNFEDHYHLVTLPNESLEFIAYWYTGDISNTSRIKSINSIPPGIIKLGTSVRIPSYLLKKKESPKEEDLKKFQLMYQ